MADDLRALDFDSPDVVKYAVTGNCDFTRRNETHKIVELCGRKIFITHGHVYGVKSGYEKIISAAKGAGVDLCLFGHTHMPDLFHENSLIFMNPGSISCPNFGYDKSYGVIDLSPEEIRPAIVTITGGTYKLLDMPTS
jgi:putative phosphoesterase